MLSLETLRSYTTTPPQDHTDNPNKGTWRGYCKKRLHENWRKELEQHIHNNILLRNYITIIIPNMKKKKRMAYLNANDKQGARILTRLRSGSSDLGISQNIKLDFMNNKKMTNTTQGPRSHRRRKKRSKNKRHSKRKRNNINTKEKNIKENTNHTTLHCKLCRGKILSTPTRAKTTDSISHKLQQQQEDTQHFLLNCPFFKKERHDLLLQNNWTHGTHHRNRKRILGQTHDQNEIDNLICYIRIIYNKRNKFLYDRPITAEWWITNSY